MATTFAVPDGRVAMAATLYTGTGTSSARSVTGVGFQPDFVWGKGRSVAYNHQLYDVVRGTGKLLNSNTTDPEQTNFTYGYLSSFDSDGFSTLAGSTNNENWNQTSATYVAWSWKAGGTAVSNTAGTITSSVSANTTAGFSVVTFTAPASGNFTFGHGLGVKPAFFIVKTRDTAGWNWSCWHQSLSSDTTSVLILNSTAAVSNAFNIWGASGSNTTVIGVTAANAVAASSACVAYCWAPVAGYSAFGSYTGNGSADGPFIYTGFRPRYILLKNTSVGSAGYDWEVVDTSRSAYNLVTAELAANLSSAESSSWNSLDILSNGFKIRDPGAAQNGSGNTMIYAAFAENPLKFSNAR